MNLNHLLRSCKLFSELETAEVAALHGIATRKEYGRGQRVFQEGERSRGFCLLVSGAVKILRMGMNGREQIIHVVEAGDSFAEAAMFMDAYPATAETLVVSSVIWIEKNGFKQLLSRDPKLSFKIIGALVTWLSRLRNTLTDLTLKEVPARFASYVLSLPSEPGKTIHVNINKTTLAQMLGTTKETLSRLLRRLASQRILTYSGNQISIHNRLRLEKIASGDEKI